MVDEELWRTIWFIYNENRVTTFKLCFQTRDDKQKNIIIMQVLKNDGDWNFFFFFLETVMTETRLVENEVLKKWLLKEKKVWLLFIRKEGLTLLPYWGLTYSTGNRSKRTNPKIIKEPLKRDWLNPWWRPWDEEIWKASAIEKYKINYFKNKLLSMRQTLIKPF